MKISNFIILFTATTVWSNPLQVGVDTGIGIKPGSSNVGFDQRKLLKLLNAIRAEKGAKPLTIDDKLTRAAQKHSIDQAKMHRMTHKGSNGSSVNLRVSGENFNWKSLAENVAFNQRTEEAVTKAWKNSPGHYKNMINPKFTKVGFGLKDWYWTEVFAT